MKRKILGVFVTVMFGCMVLSGCKKNVGTPEDNAVVENEDEQAQDTETSEGHTFGYSCIDIYNPYYDVVKESIRGELEAKGDTLVVKNPDGGKVVLLECPSQNSVNERITGFEEAIKNAGFEVVARADAGGTKESAKEKMAQILAENPQVDAVMCGNDQMALGALQAAKEAGKSSLKIYGVDGSPEMKSELTDEKSMIAGTGAQSPINVGKQAAKIGEAILNDEDYEKTT